LNQHLRDDNRLWKDGQYFEAFNPSVYPLSFSGHERNHLFFNHRGKQFTDVSGLSGLDSPQDGRGFAVCDYNRDGWPDIALVNSNAPWLNLYRNNLGPCSPDQQMVAVRFVGGNRSPKPSDQWSNRDGYGAMVHFDLGDIKLVREHRCGEGFAAQNSATMLVGIGPRDAAESLSVRWPSGKRQQIGSVQAGSLVTVFEDASQSPENVGYRIEPYRRTVLENAPLAVRQPAAAEHRLMLDRSVTDRPGGGATLRLYSTMATWCPSCKQHMPQFALLRRAFDAGSLAEFGVPIDAEDTPAKLRDYLAAYQPAYELLIDLNPTQRSEVQLLLAETLGAEVLPSTIVTDRQGRVVLVAKGIPTVSELRKLLDSVD